MLLIFRVPTAVSHQYTHCSYFCDCIIITVTLFSSLRHLCRVRPSDGVFFARADDVIERRVSSHSIAGDATTVQVIPRPCVIHYP